MKDRIRSISNDVWWLGNALGTMWEDTSLRFDEAYETRSVEMARRVEWIALRLRELVYVSSNIGRRDYFSCAAETMGIRIEEREGIYEITLPGLMPKRRSRKGTAYLIEPLYAALEEFIRGHCVVRHAHYTACFAMVL